MMTGCQVFNSNAKADSPRDLQQSDEKKPTRNQKRDVIGFEASTALIFSCCGRVAGNEDASQGTVQYFLGGQKEFIRPTGISCFAPP